MVIRLEMIKSLGRKIDNCGCHLAWEQMKQRNWLKYTFVSSRQALRQCLLGNWGAASLTLVKTWDRGGMKLMDSLVFGVLFSSRIFASVDLGG